MACWKYRDAGPPDLRPPSTGIVSRIAAASNEQSAGIEQVNEAVVQMDQVTQQNAALVEESAAAAEAMQQQAAGLAELVGTFRINAGALAGPVSVPRRSVAIVPA